MPAVANSPQALDLLDQLRRQGLARGPSQRGRRRYPLRNHHAAAVAAGGKGPGQRGRGRSTRRSPSIPLLNALTCSRSARKDLPRPRTSAGRSSPGPQQLSRLQQPGRACWPFPATSPTRPWPWSIAPSTWPARCPQLLDSRAVVHIARNEAQQALEDLASIVADKIDPVWLFHKARALMLEPVSGKAPPCPGRRPATRVSNAP